MTEERSVGVFPAFLAVIFIFSLLQTTSVAEGPEVDYKPNIATDFIDGEIYSQYSTISGTIQNEVEPISATWELHDAAGTRYFVDFTDYLEADSEISNWNEWSFEIEINPLSIGACSCISVISVEEPSGEIYTKYHSIFILPEESSDSGVQFEFPPTIKILPGSGSEWSSQTYELEFISRNFNSDNPSLSYKIYQTPDVKCSDEKTQIPADSVNIDQSEISLLDETYSMIIDIKNLSDSWYDLIVFTENPTNDRFSYDCRSIKVDNVPPVAIIDGPISIPEGFSKAYFDGSASYDDAWGIQGLTYIWTVINLDFGTENIPTVVSGSAQRSITVNTTDSGTYLVKLSISDNAGNIGTATQYLEVNNIPPVVRLTIGEDPISDNGEFTMSRDSTYMIDASGSTDTQNDADNLRYIWRINNIPTYEGASREFSWPEGVDGDFILTIEVIDDDSESSQISILVKDESALTSTPLPIIVLILSVIFFSYSVMNFRKQDSESDIPKWS